ncbi:MAG: AEC family transporter, partial [Planctomycetota bacterium]
AGGLLDALPSVAITVAGVGLTIAVGFYLRRSRTIADGTDASVFALLVRVFIPALILSRVIGNEALSDWRNLVLPPATAFGLVTLGMLTAFGLATLMPKTLPAGKTRRTFALSAGMFNYGYITVPLVIALFAYDGGRTLAVLFVFNVGVEAAMWGVGLTLLAGHVEPGWWRRMFSPPVLATVIAVAVNLTDQALGLSESMPAPVAGVGEAIMTCLFWLGGAAVPMGLILTGSAIADDWLQCRLRQGVRTVVAASVLRLLILPALFIGLAVMVPMTPELRHVLIFQAAMPAAVFPIVLARHYQGDVGTALRVAIGTSIVAIVTMPIWIVLGLWLIR